MSFYEKLKVVRCPFSEKFSCDNEFDLESKYPEKFSWSEINKFTVGITEETNFVDFVIERDTDAYGEYGTARYLTTEEVEKYLPMFLELAPEVDADELRIVEYCYYNCSEPPCYYDVK